MPLISIPSKQKMGAVELGYKGALAILVHTRKVFQHTVVKGKEREIA